MKTCAKCGNTEFYDDGHCAPCARLRATIYRTKNPEKCKKIKNICIANNPEIKKLTNARWQKENNKMHNASTKKYRKAHPERECARVQKRNAAKLQATPEWAIDFIIKEAYALSALRTKMTGIKWHVDHIVPLRSKLVCGFHVHNNLQVIPAVHNCSKSNRYWPDMP